MKSHTQKNHARLLQYAAAAIAIAATGEAQSQVIYTDIDPDTVLAFTGPDDFLLDLNHIFFS